jgi:hypothetical protein
MIRTLEQQAAIDADIARYVEDMLERLAAFDREHPERAALRTQLWCAMEAAAEAYGDAVGESGRVGSKHWTGAKGR